MPVRFEIHADAVREPADAMTDSFASAPSWAGEPLRERLRDRLDENGW